MTVYNDSPYQRLFTDYLGNVVSIQPGETQTFTTLEEYRDRELTLAGNATISGTNTGDQTITLSGAVTGTGTGAITTALGSFSSANLLAALTTKTGTGNPVFSNTPSISDLRIVDPADPTGITGGTLISMVGVNTTIVAGHNSGGVLKLQTGGSAFGSTTLSVDLESNPFGGVTYHGINFSVGRPTAFINSNVSGFSFLTNASTTAPIFVGAINGNTITAGTGVLTLAAGKTFTASNTLTLAGTDGTSLNIGDGTALAALAAFTPGTNVSVFAAGTVYSLTATPAALDFGTTDPTLVIPSAGKWLLIGRAYLAYNGATYAGNQTATIKLRRTNNTATDITGATTTGTMRIITTLTDSVGIMTLPIVVYTTANADDSISVFGSVSATPAAGSVDVQEASILAVKLS